MYISPHFVSFWMIYLSIHLSIPFSFFQWIPEIKDHCPDTPIVLVGTKLDLREGKKSAYDTNRIRESFPQIVGHTECSAKTGVSVCLMMTSSNGSIFRVTGPLCGEFTGHRWIPLTKASDAELWWFLWCALNIRLSKQWWCWRFETPSRPLWRQSNAWCDLHRLVIYVPITHGGQVTHICVSKFGHHWFR